MSQKRVHSLIEQILNVASGFCISLIVWTAWVVPAYDVEVTMTDNLAVTTVFTLVSIIRGYCWRRYFNYRSEHERD